MAAEANLAMNNHSQDSHTVSKPTMDPESSEAPSQPEMVDKEGVHIEYIHGSRFGLIFAS